MNTDPAPGATEGAATGYPTVATGIGPAITGPAAIGLDPHDAQPIGAGPTHGEQLYPAQQWAKGRQQQQPDDIWARTATRHDRMTERRGMV